MDGQFHAIEFDPSATADEVLKLVKAKIGLRDSAQGRLSSSPFHCYNRVVTKSKAHYPMNIDLRSSFKNQPWSKKGMNGLKPNI